MSESYYVRAVIGVHVQKNELWGELKTGKMVCDYNHESPVKKAKHCMECGRKLHEVIERVPKALLEATVGMSVDARDPAQFSDWWSAQGHHHFLKIGIGDMSPISTNRTRDEFLVLGILVGDVEAFSGGGAGDVSLNDVQNAIAKMSEISKEYLNNRPIKLYTSLKVS